jgi:hypothetical protein
MNLLRKIWLFLLGLFGPKKRSCFSGVEFLALSASADVALKTGKLVVLGEHQKYKWLQFICPCGCGEIQALNLMRSHYPLWTVEIHEDATLTVHPSVHAQRCGAHFWVRRNEIIWC